MNQGTANFKKVFLVFVFLLTGFSSLAEEPMQTPLFLSKNVRPIMMLNMSPDHQLFFKLYDDYADITDDDGGESDGIPDTTYNNNYKYYGYFDSNKCYEYFNDIFIPKESTDDHYCRQFRQERWSGNFLNWLTMTRLDAVRKILYGGYRKIDAFEQSYTVLERALLPNDAHSFAKYYDDWDLERLTPLEGQSDGYTFCSTSIPDNRNKYSHSTPSVPVFRIIKGNYSLWAASERWQCLYRTEINALENPRPARGQNFNEEGSGIDAESASPIYKQYDDFIVRVKVCEPNRIDLNNDEQCRAYNTDGKTIYKPAGLLQEYGEDDSIYFGLMTGTWGKNKSGGVLRKNASSFSDEVNDDGSFRETPANGGIINTLNQVSIYGYSWWNGTYNNASVANCAWASDSFVDGQCHNWGNPQAEIYLESLRYLAGKQPNSEFYSDDSRFFSGLSDVPSWIDPISSGENGNHCAPLNILQFNTSSSSYDTDSLSKANTDFSLDIDLFTNRIGAAEGIHGGTYFVGNNGIDSNNTCTAKSISSLGAVQGSCPDAPSLEGGYDLAGLAFSARSEGIGNDREKVKTFGVSLSPAIPKVEVPVPGNDGQFLTIVPSCFNAGTNVNCAIVDFKVVESVKNNNRVAGKVYVNWEDSRWGGDYDMDMWGTLSYEVTSTKATVTTDVFRHTSGPEDKMGFGYVINGTTQDGFHAHSGIGGYNYFDASGVLGCNSCVDSAGPTSYTYTLGASEAKFLQPALYYASKWGGYENDELSDAQIAAREPDNYFNVTEPRELKDSLADAFDRVSKSRGASAGAAANSSRLSGDSYVYQARFNTADWSGQVVAYPIEWDGTVDMTKNPTWDTNETLTENSERKIYTYGRNTRGNGELKTLLINRTNNRFGNIRELMNALGKEDSNAMAEARLAWLYGEDSSGLRQRDRILGDVINSDPAYTGAGNQQFNTLPDGFGSDSYLTYVRNKSQNTPALYFGANDGMLHALNAQTGEEIFAYIPRGAYSKLSALMNVDFEHQYLVDGSVYIGDAFLSLDDFSPSWRTIVVGSLGYGGRGVFALDITESLKDPTQSPEVIFDFTASDQDSPIKDDIGFILNKPIIAPVADGSWRVIFGNGVNSEEGTAKLITINLDDPYEDITVIDTKSGFTSTNDNGLSGVALLPNTDGLTTVVYGGDIRGNVWKFDLTDTQSENWKVGLGTENEPKPIITVVDDENNPQPISTNPTLGYNYLKHSEANPNEYAIMVYFVTGKYYTNSDIASDSTQSIYAIADVGRAYELSATNRSAFLHKKSISQQTLNRRTISDDKNVDWGIVNGWFLDLGTPKGITGGERGISKSLLVYNRLIVTTFMPSQSMCEYGGSGWLMELNAINGIYNDEITLLEEDANTLLDTAVLSDLSPVTNEDEIYLLASSLGDGDEEPPLESFLGSGFSGIRGRISWNEVRLSQ